MKSFADDTSIFLVDCDVNTFSKELNDDLKKLNDWAFQRKISFSLDSRKQSL